jgi:hypothetical protein
MSQTPANKFIAAIVIVTAPFAMGAFFLAWAPSAPGASRLSSPKPFSRSETVGRRREARRGAGLNRIHARNHLRRARSIRIAAPRLRNGRPSSVQAPAENAGLEGEGFPLLPFEDEVTKFRGSDRIVRVQRAAFEPPTRRFFAV